ncbi:MAG: helicase C-terminal domain-containing protein [Anaerolineae bacterium]
MKASFVALDLETTGLNPETDQILEIGAVRIHSDGEIETWSTLVNPGVPIPIRIQQLTGISPDELSHAPTLRMVLPSIRHFVQDATIVGHNVAFDLAFLQQVGLAKDNPYVDTFTLASVILPRQQSYSLGSLAQTLGIELTNAHRALADAQATAQLFLALIRYAETHIRPQIIREINTLSLRCVEPWPLRKVFMEIERRQARRRWVAPPPAESSDQEEAWHELELEAPDRDAPILSPLDIEALTAMLEPGGDIARSLPGFEYRPQQVEMLRAVAEAMNTGDHLFVEAETGTGKSLAYLLPAALFAWQNRERVIISTNTINLQDQLLQKDIPSVQRALGLPLQCTVLKGRSNYLCRRRFSALCRSTELTPAEMTMVARVLIWDQVTTTGDQAELFLPSAEDRALWGRICSDATACTTTRCRYRSEDCYFTQARQRAYNAHLIVINHALLFSDAAAGRTVLPPHRHQIIDEAHHLEDAITQAMAFTASMKHLDYRLSRILPSSQRGNLLALALRRVEELAGTPDEVSALADAAGQVERQAAIARTALRLFFDAIHAFLTDHVSQRLDGPYNARIPIDSGLRAQPAWGEVEMHWDEADAQLQSLTEQLSRFASRAEQVDDEDEGLVSLCAEIRAISTLVGEWRTNIGPLVGAPDPNAIYWIEVDASDGELSLHSAPLQVGRVVEENLWGVHRSVIMTSATLRTAGSFDYIKEQLNGHEVPAMAVDSPFDYREQALLYIPTDMPEPNSRDYQAAVETAIIELARATEGRLLALFTSYNQLRQTTEAVTQALYPEGFIIFSQGDGASRTQLLESFRTTPRAVLLGTRSFWEGVDVIGEALSALVICKLPFAVPNDPIIQARSQLFLDPFNEYYLPDAILRFRQGFGRLIRSRDDVGICVILDRRVVSKAYGQRFLESLPSCYELRRPLSLLPEAARRWLARRRPAHGHGDEEAPTAEQVTANRERKP